VAGQEVCGTVDGAGAGVDLAPGTRVMAVTNFFDGRGGLAEATVARADSAFRVPPEMSDAEAACFRIGYSTAWIGLVRRGALRAGERLLVLGAAGGSGLAAVRLGRALGARVIAVASGGTRGDRCRRAGAHEVVDRAAEDLPARVAALTGGAGVDVVFDPVGGAMAAESVACLAGGGRLLAVGFASGSWVEPDVGRLVLRNASLVGVYAGGLTRPELEADHEELLALAASGSLASDPTVVPFETVPEALEQIERAGAPGKLVVGLPGGR
jgi:NADPH2:quinone reductase